MNSKVFNPKMDPADESVPISHGGTGARLKEDACSNLGLVSRDQVRKPYGVITLGEDKLIRKGDLPHDLVNVATPTLSGEQSVVPGYAVDITITNYSSDVTYVMEALGGTVTRESDLITFQTNNTPMDGWVKVNGRQFDVYIGEARASRPYVIWPVTDHSVEDNGPSITVISSDFDHPDPTISHVASDWVVFLDAELTRVFSEDYEVTGSMKTEFLLSGLDENSDYYVVVRHISSNGSYSLWSEPRQFSTREYFAPIHLAEKITEVVPVNEIYFGYTMDLSDDAGTMVISAAHDIGDSGHITIYQQTDGEYTTTAHVSANMDNSRPIAVHLEIPVGGSIAVSMDAVGWSATNYTTSADFTIPAGSATRLTLTGKGGAGSRTLNPGQGMASYPDGLPVYNPGQAYIEPSLKWTKIATNDVVDLVFAESFQAGYYTPTALPSPTVLDEEVSIYHWVDDEEYVTVYRDRYVAEYDLHTGQAYIPETGDIAYPDGLPAYIAPFYTEIEGAPAIASLNGVPYIFDGGVGAIAASNYTHSIMLGDIYGFGYSMALSGDGEVLAIGGLNKGRLSREFDVKVPDSGVVTFTTNSPSLPSRSFVADGSLTLPLDATAVTLTGRGALGPANNTLAATSKTYTGIGNFTYNKYISAFRITAKGGPAGTVVHPQVGSPSYPSGLPAYVPSSPAVFSWVPAPKPFGVWVAGVLYSGISQLAPIVHYYELNGNMSRVRTQQADGLLLASDTKEQSGSYATVTQYINFMKTRSYVLDYQHSPLEPRYHTLTYSSHTVSGNTGIISYTKENAYQQDIDNGGEGGELMKDVTIDFRVEFTLVQTAAAVAQVGQPAYPNGLPPYVAGYTDYTPGGDTVVNLDGQTVTFSGQGGTTVHHAQQGLPQYPNGLLPYRPAIPYSAKWSHYTQVYEDGVTTEVITDDPPYASYPSIQALKTYLDSFYANSGLVSGDTLTYDFFYNHGGKMQRAYHIYSLVVLSNASPQVGLPAYPYGLPVYVAAYDTYTPGEGGITIHHDQVGYPQYPSGLPPYQAAVAYSAVWRKQDQTIGGYSLASYPTIESLKTYLDGAYGHSGTITNNTLKYDYYEAHEVWIPPYASGDSTGGGYYQTEYIHIYYLYSLVVLTSASPQVGLPAYPSGLPTYVAAYDEYVPAAELSLVTVNLTTNQSNDHPFTYNVAGLGSCLVETFLTVIPSERIDPLTQLLSGKGELVLPYGVTSVSYSLRGGGSSTNGASSTFTLAGTTVTAPGNPSGNATPVTSTISVSGAVRHVVNYDVANDGSMTIIYSASQPTMSTIPAYSKYFTSNGYFLANRNVDTLTLSGRGGHGSISSTEWVDYSTSAGDGYEYHMALDSDGRCIVSTDACENWRDVKHPVNQTIASLSRSTQSGGAFTVLMASRAVYGYDPVTEAWSTLVSPSGVFTVPDAEVFHVTGKHATALVNKSGEIISTAGLQIACPYLHPWVDAVDMNGAGASYMLLSSDGHVAVYSSGWVNEADQQDLPGTETWLRLIKQGSRYYAFAASGAVYTSSTVGSPWVSSFSLDGASPLVTAAVFTIGSKSYLSTLALDGKIYFRDVAQSKWFLRGDIDSSEPIVYRGEDSYITINGKSYYFPGGVGQEAPTKTYTVQMGKYRTELCRVSNPSGNIRVSHLECAVTDMRGAPVVVSQPERSFNLPGRLAGEVAYTTRNFTMPTELLYTGSISTSIKTPTGWTNPRTIMTGDSEKTDYGFSIDLDRTGLRMVTGTSTADEKKGAAYIYVRDGDNWILEAYLTPVDGVPGDRFGSSTVISGDGTIVAVSAIFSYNQRAAVYIYQRTGTAWELLDVVYHESTAGYNNPTIDDLYWSKYFQRALAISHDGDTLAVGMPSYQGTGGVAVYNRIGDKYQLETVLVSTLPVTGQFYGAVVTMDDDGKTIATTCHVTYAGESTVELWVKYARTWTMVKRSGDANLPLTVIPGQYKDVRLAGDASVLAIGVPWETVSGVANAGAVILQRSDV